MKTNIGEKSFPHTLKCVFASALTVAGILFCSGIGSAQSLQTQSIGTTQPAQPDSIVQITAEAQGLTAVPYNNLPRGGTYWEVLPSGISAPLPCPPLDSTLPIYGITGNIFLVDATGGQVTVNPRRLGMQVQTQITASAFNAALESLAVSVVNLITQVQNPPATLTASPMMQMSMMSSSLASSYAYGNSVYLKNMTASIAGDGSTTANFSIAGGTNFVPYDILTTTNLLMPVAQWSWIGIGYTSNNYTFYEQPADYGFYMLAKPSKTMVVPWGDDVYGQCDIWTGITNAVQVTGGYEFSLALLNNGTVVGWGFNGVSSSELVPAGLSGVTMIASGWQHNVALLTNGMVTAWGDNFYGEINVPAGLSNVMVISAQALHSLALKTNGTVVAWGYGPEGETTVPTGLTNVTAISAGGEHNLVVSNGYVIAWGYNGYGQCAVPTNLNNVVDVATGWAHSLALKSDGTVVAWGDNSYGERNVPSGLSNVVAIAAGGDPDTDTAYSLALKSDGTVVGWGDSDVIPVGGLNNVIALGSGANHALAVRTGPPTPVITLEPTDHVQAIGGNVSFAAKGQGLYGVTYQWQTNGVNLPGATSTTLNLTNVQAAQQTAYNVVVTDNGGMGSIVSSNANLYLVTPPVIISQAPLPTNQLAVYQKNLSLSVSATAPGQYSGFPLNYQWQFNGTNITGANSTNYTFLVDTPTLGNYSVIVSNATGGATSLVWQVTMTYAGSYIDVGTLAYHLSTNAVGHTNGYTDIYNATTEIANWTYAQYGATNMYLLTNAVWSTNFWLAGVQGLSATPIGGSNNLGGQGLLTMVSPRHYLFATHMNPQAFMMAFLDTNNIIYWRTTLQRVDIGNDTSIGILNTDLPPSVGFLPVIPTNFSNYLPTNSTSYVQGIGMNQGMRLFSQPMALGNPYINWSSSATAPFGLITDWNSHIVGGDSSDPEVILISNQLVLVSHNYQEFTNTWTGDGPNYIYQFTTINQKMHYLSTNNNISTDYQLTPYSLTNWPVIH